MKSFLETWRPVVGYEGLYEVSDFGDVRSLGKLRGRGKGYFIEGRIMKLAKDKDGYLQVNLYKEGKLKIHRVHRLVAQAFLENPNNLPCINHKDEDKTNNVVTNIEYCDHAYNNRYGTRTERQAEALRGVKRPDMSEVLRNNPKKSEIVLQMTLDYVLVKEWPSTQECGRNGFDQGAVSKCCNNKYGKQGNVYKGFRWVNKEDYYKQVA